MADNEPKSDEQKGLVCQNCGSRALKVVWIKKATGARNVRRRRCQKCGTLCYTAEQQLGAK